MKISRKEIEQKIIKDTKFNLSGTQLMFMADGYEKALKDIEAKENNQNIVVKEKETLK